MGRHYQLLNLIDFLVFLLQQITSQIMLISQDRYLQFYNFHKGQFVSFNILPRKLIHILLKNFEMNHLFSLILVSCNKVILSRKQREKSFLLWIQITQSKSETTITRSVHDKFNCITFKCNGTRHII